MSGQSKHNPFWGDIFTKNKEKAKLSTADFLRSIPIFEDLSRREINRHLNIIHEREFKPGEYLFKVNQPGTAMFIIADGEVEIVLPNKEGQETILATLKPGNFLGELAMLDESPRSASARGKTHTKALAFFRSDLNRLLDIEPIIASKIYKALSLIIGMRLKATNDRLAEIDNRKLEKSA